MSLELQELAAAIEAVIYVASDPVTPKVLAAAFPDETPEALQAALAHLTKAYEAHGRGLMLDRVAGGYRITTRPEVHPHVLRYVQREKAERLSLRTLETLSVIAYKQPVTAAEIAEIRGVDPGGTIKTLLDRGLIRIVGRKKVVGRPFVYGTTRSFLTTFGLDDLSVLPSLKEIAEITTDLPTGSASDIEPVTDASEADDGGMPPEEPADGGGSAARTGGRRRGGAAASENAG